MGLLNNTDVFLFDTIAELAQYLDANIDESAFPRSRVMFANRDTFYGNLKYGVIKEKLNADDVFQALVDEPVVAQEMIYAYFAAYAEWIANRLGSPAPNWVFSDRAMQFADWNISFDPGPATLEATMDDIAPEFYNRGLLVSNEALEIA